MWDYLDRIVKIRVEDDRLRTGVECDHGAGIGRVPQFGSSSHVFGDCDLTEGCNVCL